MIIYEDALPGLDVFVCTADPKMEPPNLVINTVLSMMAHDWPSEKLSVYLSDDGGSDLTFYALLEASHFSKHWIPFCKKFNVEPRSPAVYFAASSHPNDTQHATQWLSIKELHEKMENRILAAIKLGRVPEDIKAQHKGFSEWNSVESSRNHQAIVEILIDGRDPNAVDIEGSTLPTLVYLSREKRPGYHHNFKAGALNALIRTSSVVSNGPIILTVDCDMYSNNAQAARDAMCCFMDENKGHEIAYVQYPQGFHNLTKNDMYAGSYKLIYEMEFRGHDGNGGPPYIGSGCLFRRESLCGKKCSEGCQVVWKKGMQWGASGSAKELEETAKCLASCTCEENTSWGKETSSPWFVPFAYAIACKYVYGLGEELWAGETFKSWWNQQRMWLYRRVASYCFATIDTLLKLSGLGKSAFDITAKDTDEEVAKRYEQEKMEFGSNSPMFTVLATVAMVNLFCFLGSIKRVVFMGNVGVGEAEALMVQWVLCGALVIINWPIYEGLFLRKDNGRLPPSVAFQSIGLAIFACLIPLI
ncbi:hypothetical protein ACLOJK_041701 [Asimina triloba]